MHVKWIVFNIMASYTPAKLLNHKCVLPLRRRHRCYFLYNRTVKKWHFYGDNNVVALACVYYKQSHRPFFVLCKQRKINKIFFVQFYKKKYNNCVDIKYIYGFETKNGYIKYKVYVHQPYSIRCQVKFPYVTFVFFFIIYCTIHARASR